jgi:hypothetical protein
VSNKKFILNSTELGRVILNDDPIGWDEVKKIYTRNPKYIGVFRKRTAALKFIGDGLQYCIDLFKLRGTEAVLNVVVMEKQDYEDAWVLDFEGVGKFNPFKKEWGEDLSPMLSIEFEDSGFHNKFLTRANKDINIGNQLSIDGVNVGAMPTKKIQVAQRSIKEYNNFVLSVNDKYQFNMELTDPYIDSYKGHVIPIEKVNGETEFITTPTDYLIETPGLICDFVSVPTALKVKYDISGSGHMDTTASAGDNQIGWYVRIFSDNDLSIYTDTILFEILGIPFDANYPFAFDFNGTLDITLAPNQAFTILGIVDLDRGPSLASPYDIDYDVCNIEIDLIQNFDEYVSDCHYRYEFMQRLVQLATDQIDCFKSSVFGRIENGYVANGKYWNNVLYNGYQVRGFTDRLPVWSFEKSFKSVRSIWNVGCGIEKIGSKYKVVVEEIPYFFRGDIAITLHNVRKVSSDVSEQFTFSEVRVGYEKAEYEEVNGLEEYNNKSIYATYIKSDDNVLDLISPERADGYGREFARRRSVKVAASEDTSYDNELFIDMVVDDGGLLRSEKNENYTDVYNINSPETAANLDITPKRNLLRNGDWVYGCCYKFLDEYLRFLSSDKASDLSTLRTGETTPTVEQESIQNNKLISSLWLNVEDSFEADLTQAQLQDLDKKWMSLIKWSPFSREQTKKYYYGWMLDVSAGGKERSGEFVLLRANVNSDRLKIIDPDGVYQEYPGEPSPPAGGAGGFEYSFENEMEA